MKSKTTLFLLTVLITSFCFSQNKKRDLFVSLQAAPFISGENSNDIGVIGTVSFEVLVANNISITTGFFTSNNTLFKNENGTTIHSYGILPSVQYYIINKSKFNIFGTLGYGFGFEDLTRSNIENSALTIFNIGVGGNYEVANNLYLKLTIPYISAKNITINENALEGVAPFLGINYKL